MLLSLVDIYLSQKKDFLYEALVVEISAVLKGQDLPGLCFAYLDLFMCKLLDCVPF